MHHGSGVHEGHDVSGHGSMGGMMQEDALKRRFFICLVAAVPVLLLSPMMGIELPFRITFPYSQWVVLALATFLFFYGGRPFLTGAIDELRAKRPAMMTLIALGIISAYVYSLYAFIVTNLLPHGEHVMDFFWELATLIVIMLLGHWIEMKAMAGSGDALKKMAELLPSRASVRKSDGVYVSVALSSVEIGQVVSVKAGERIPTDGTVVEGSTDVNEAMVTGEARSVSKTVGDTVIGGSLNGSGNVLVKVTGTGDSGYLAQVMHLVGSAQAEKSKAETMSDKVARLLFFAAVLFGAVTFIVWLLITQDLATAVTRLVTVLVIACPHALGLAIPLVAARSISLGAKHGLLVRKRRALEVVPKIDVIAMDKTGTLTEGDFKVTAIISFDSALDENDIVARMAALETGSSHPLAVGILAEAEKRGLVIDAASDIDAIAGVGLTGTLTDGTEASIVTAAYLEKNGISFDRPRFEDLAAKGNSVSFLVDGETVQGLIAEGDTIKPDARQLVDSLTSLGVRSVMLTGDNEKAAAKVAGLLGLDDFRAGLLPDGKVEAVEEYQAAGRKVMMVGDGVNDAPSLARADVGVAIGAGTDIAIDSADVVLVRSDPGDIRTLFSLAKRTTRKMVQNLWWGAGYNIIALPLAAGVLAPVGIVLSPAVGAVLMSLSTVIVSINAMTLTIDE